MRSHALSLALLIALLTSACHTPRSGTGGAPAPLPSAPDTATELDAEFRQKEAAARAAALNDEQHEAHRAHQMEQQARAAAQRLTPAALMHAPTPPPPRFLPQNRENYGRIHDNPIRLTAEDPVSTFSIDVDRGSYSNVRRILQSGELPPRDAVRVEEFINAFDYGYPSPEDPARPFAIHAAMMQTPWNRSTQLLQIGLKGYAPPADQYRPSNLVFLVDVSGSMEGDDRLALVKSALKALARTLTREDRISLVVYAGSEGLVLEPTPGDRTAVIDAALDQLEAGGSTNGGDGIRLAYAMAQRAWMSNGNNRVLLCTDGDFNVGTVSFEQLLDLVKEKRKSGVALTTLGFGAGNYNDHLMEQLANVGNGSYAYIDSMAEARRVLVEERNATLLTIAQDVKVQLEFNPAVVQEYRLIGYENRILKREDFKNDQVDAGDVGAGHSVTALYELTLVGEGPGRIDPLRYAPAAKASPGKTDELGFVQLRYKHAGENAARGIGTQEQALLLPALRKANVERLRLAAAAAAFGQMLRGGAQLEGFGYEQALALARSVRLPDPHARIPELRQLMQEAQKLSTAAAPEPDPED